MLSLTRRVGQTLVIGDGIVIDIIAISKNRVRLGVTADKKIPVIRGEAKKKKGPAVCAETSQAPRD